MLNLRADLASVGRSAADCARHTGVSTATISLAINFNRWPKARVSGDELRERIRQYLTACGAPSETVAATFDEAPTEPRANAVLREMAQATTSGPQPGSTQGEDTRRPASPMSLSAQGMAALAARRSTAHAGECPIQSPVLSTGISSTCESDQ